MAVTTPPSSNTAPDILLDIEGMTCASCANRTQKKLNKVEGVRATVNYATEKATVQVPREMSAEDVIAVVEKAGYGARRSAPEAARVERADVIKPRMMLAFALAIPVVAVSMVPAFQFPAWQWCALILTAIIVFWCGRSFHAATLANLRHGTTTMDTLVSLGTLASWLWSAIAVLFTNAGAIGMTMDVSWLPMSDGTEHDHPDLYFESAAVVTTFLLVGRWLEQRAKRRSGAALRALLDLAPTVARVRTASGDSDIPAAHVKMMRNQHKPGNMAVLVQSPRPGLRTFEDALEAGPRG